jgi:hypothetical protein
MQIFAQIEGNKFNLSKGEDGCAHMPPHTRNHQEPSASNSQLYALQRQRKQMLVSKVLNDDPKKKAQEANQEPNGIHVNIRKRGHPCDITQKRAGK